MKGSWKEFPMRVAPMSRLTIGAYISKLDWRKVSGSNGLNTRQRCNFINNKKFSLLSGYQTSFLGRISMLNYEHNYVMGMCIVF